MVMKHSTKVIRLIPQFRLMFKSLKKTQKEEGLKDIDEVLLAPLWLPTEQLYDKLDALSKQEKNAICDCLFYALNFFRELINCFAQAGQENVQEQRIVLLRLKHILKLQDLLRNVLSYNLSYIPPTMLHLEDVSGWQVPESKSKGSGPSKSGKSTKRGKKRKAAVQDITNMDSQQLAQDQEMAPDKNSDSDSVVDLHHYKPFFREWDTTVFQILTYKLLVITPEPDDEIEDPQLRPKEFLMLLKDLNSKLNHVLVASKNKKTFPGKSKIAIGFSNLDSIGPTMVMETVVPLIENILADIEVISSYFQNIIAMNDGVRDAAGTFNQDTFPLYVACLEQAFEVLKSILSWNGLRDNVSLMREALGRFDRRGPVSGNDTTSIKQLTEMALKYLSKFTDVMLNISCASEHLKLIEVIDNLGEAGGKILHETSLEYLSRVWMASDGKLPEKGAKFNAFVETCLSIYLTTSDEKGLDIVTDFATNGLTALATDEEDFETGDKFSTLTKHTFGVHFRVLLNYLVQYIKKITYGHNKNFKKQMKIWDSATKSLMTMTELMKKWSKPQMILGPLSKGYRAFLEHFLKHCMPLMDKMFSQRREDCIALLKSMQASSRQMQYVCSHSKIKKDVALSNNVPLLKRALESFVFRVKEMLALNNAVDVFWLGNLRQRDIQGQEIPSQIMSQSIAEDDVEDDLVDESDIDMEVDDNGNGDKENEEESLEY